MSNQFVSIVEEAPDGELYIELPLELLASVGWDETTTLEWVITEEGTVLLKKVEV